MEKDIKLPFTQEELLEDLPAERSLSEMPERYRTLFQECLQEYVENRRNFGRELADLTVSLAGNLKDGFQNAVKWVDSLIPDFDFAPAPNYAYATRAIGGDGGNEKPTKMSFEKTGDGCSLKIDLELAGSGANVKVAVLDGIGNAILPFSLTVTDVDSGKVLLPRREFTAGAANIKGVKMGRYEIAASAGSAKCDFLMAVE